MKIVIADDHQLIVRGLSDLILNELPETVIYTARDKAELFGILQRESIDLLFQDIRFGRYDAREFVKSIRDTFPLVKVVMISMFDEQEIVNSLFHQGVSGYIAKSDAGDEIVAAINAVRRGETYFSTDIQKNTRGLSLEIAPQISLTAREKEVLETIMEGKTIRQAAKEMLLSEKTIETYRANLFLKFEVGNAASLVRRALLEGYL